MNQRYLFAFGIPVIYAFVIRAVFLNDLFSIFITIMSLAFLTGVPMGIGILTLALSPADKAAKNWYRIFAPWLPIILFLLIAAIFAFEGMICIIMAAPFFLIFASIGGLIAGFARNKKLNTGFNVFAALLVPFLILPAESSIDQEPVKYDAVTSILISAPGEKIWNNVVRVREIKEHEDNGKLSKFMGFPRPIKAELDTLQTGGKRLAIFDRGLVFDETVYEYEHKRKMSFSIVPQTDKIPPDAMDEHIIVGGKYFTVLNGTYEMLPADNNNINLVLYSRFQMNTTFNFYSGFWAELIMKDIQNNILGIIKQRSEQ